MQSEAGKLQTVGVLAIQGSVQEHLDSLGRLPKVNTVAVKYPHQLDEIDKLIIPGGESTAICKILTNFGFVEKIQEYARHGMPIWGTCAGMILMAKKLERGTPCLGIMDICVTRNAYGSQLDSFVTKRTISEISEEALELVFIRAPYIYAVASQVDILLTINEKIVAARQKNLFVTSFHPELTKDSRVHQYFTQMI